MKKIIFHKLANQLSNKYSDIYYESLKKMLVGKTIEFKGMSFSDNDHNWKKFNIKVKNIRPFNSGQTFQSEIEVVATDGKIYTIHSEYPVLIK